MRSFPGLAFKVAADPYIGTLTFYRIYSGKVKAGDMVWNPRTPTKTCFPCQFLPLVAFTVKTYDL